MSFISKILGIDDANEQASRANDLQQQSMDLTRREYEESKAEKQRISNQISGLMQPLLNQVYGGINGNKQQKEIGYYSPASTAGSNGMGNTAFETMTNLIDVLTGRQVLKEQETADNLTNQLIDNLTGKVKTNEQKQADNWNQQYLNMLQNSPDTAFNMGLSTVNRNAQSQQDAVSKQMANRGIGGSGIALGQIAGTEANKARQISELQGQKVDRATNNAGIGAQFANGLSQQQLNNMSAANSLSQGIAQRKQSNLENAGVYANNYNQQLLTNIMNMLGNQTNLANNTGAASLAANSLQSGASTAAANANAGMQGANALISAGTNTILDNIFNNKNSNANGANAGQNAINNAVKGITDIGKTILGLF